MFEDDEVGIADVKWVVKVTDDCVADGLAVLAGLDEVLDVDANPDIGHVKNDVKV